MFNELSHPAKVVWLYFKWNGKALDKGVKLIFKESHISLPVAFKGLYKCNYFLTVKQELGTAAG